MVTLWRTTSNFALCTRTRTMTYSSLCPQVLIPVRSRCKTNTFRAKPWSAVFLHKMLRTENIIYPHDGQASPRIYGRPIAGRKSRRNLPTSSQYNIKHGYVVWTADRWTPKKAWSCARGNVQLLPVSQGYLGQRARGVVILVVTCGPQPRLCHYLCKNNKQSTISYTRHRYA